MKSVGLGFLSAAALALFLRWVAMLQPGASENTWAYWMLSACLMLTLHACTQVKQPKRSHWMLGVTGWYLAAVGNLAIDRSHGIGDPILGWVGIAVATLSVGFGLKYSYATW